MNLPSATVGFVWLSWLLLPLNLPRLLIVTAVTAFCAEFRELVQFLFCLLFWHNIVVASIEETAVRYHIPKNFIGLILLPIVVRNLGSSSESGSGDSRAMQLSMLLRYGWLWRTRWRLLSASALAAPSWVPVWVFRTRLLNATSANRRFRRPIACHRGLDVSFITSSRETAMLIFL